MSPPPSLPLTLPALVPGPTPEGATLSRSGFDGGAFAAVLAVHPRKETSPAQVLEEIAPVLRAAGFQRDLADLAGPDEALRLEPPDLKALSAEICREAALRRSEASTAVCAALRDGRLSDRADMAFRNAYGVGFAEWKAGMEHASFQYPFSQIIGGVPIEGAGISAFRREGESVSLVHGSLFNRYTVVNRAVSRRRDAVLAVAFKLLAGLSGDRSRLLPLGEPELVLVKDGTVGRGGEAVAALRYAWRVLVGLPGGRKSLMIWVDAERGSLLRTAPQWKDASDSVEVDAVRWRRDPGLCKPGTLPCTEILKIQVNDANNLVLELKDVFDRLESSDPGQDVQVKSSSGGFNQSPINDDTTAVCLSGNNSAFRQVNAYSHLYSLWKIVRTAGLVPTFPEKPLRVVIDDEVPDTEGSSAYYDAASGQRDAKSSLWLADGEGFRDKALCPTAQGVRLNGAQDVTVMAHETAHLFVQRLQERRPDRWCNCSKCKACPMPDSLGHNIVHDFADSFAFAYASINCFAGWTAKNKDGFNANLHCQGPTHEGGGFPRKAELPQDRFPEHRGISQTEYANGQIGAAALWEVRKGLRSKAPVTGTEEYWVQLLRSFWSFGFLNNTCSSFTVVNGRNVYSSCDRDVFLYLQDLERRMVAEWVVSGSGQTANKVVSGFAKAGIYLVPFNCLDGKLSTTDPDACPSDPKLESALDAVIEIEDGNTKDDPVVDDVVHPEDDYLAKDVPPRFKVWTGPHYRFAGDGSALLGAAPPCGDRYEVELSADDKFSSIAWSSGQQSVKAGQACRGEVALSLDKWEEAQKKLGKQVYYRVRTWDSLGRERVSTSPGGGAFKIPAPFAMITSDGKP